MHTFIVLLHYASTPGRGDDLTGVTRMIVEAPCYADAVALIAPGIDCYKIEVIAV